MIRNVLRVALTSAAFALLAACAPAEQSQPSDKTSTETKQAAAVVPRGEGFDFYVLALSWSPSYCEAEGEQANGQQCRAGRPYGFVVHGLWPQYERGFPESCPTGNSDVSSDRLRSLYDLIPSAGLIRHQWRKHGSCSGLGQDDYFKVLRAAREKIEIPKEFKSLESYRTLSPDQAERAFLQSNPQMSAASVAVTCDRRLLREVRICMGKDLAFRACPEIDRRSCRLDRVVMPPVRAR
ncbi:ribonuclease T2 family protein [Aminobacter carboxidus]|uniref:Ribonuclease T2 n=1 Tax=Aminobacter carboxidus TaxID=376165 RepID=A0A8E1WJ27_9HYPH|nr:MULTISPECIES: ribonuclease T2 [Aminobacter carboxidus group]MBB6469965.1 ribonuclease T2 [Aminobacter lissarensis]MBE1203244.1 ribonuclease T2 [Aminobacter carboxidus]